VVKALNRIGATQTMEDFIFFIINIASGEPHSLRPVYSVVPTDPMEEWEAPQLKGYRGDGPRSNRQCRRRPGPTRHLWQHHSRDHADVLRPPPAHARATARLFRTAETMGENRQALSRSSPTPASGNIADARASIRIRSRCAGPDATVLAAIAQTLGLLDRAAYWNDAADHIHAAADREGLE
jgi:hypothetical protein